MRRLRLALAVTLVECFLAPGRAPNARSLPARATKGLEPDTIPVVIEAPSRNSRKLSASVIVARPPEDVWRILTDYDRLSTHVPNLVVSRRVPSPTPGGIRLFQEGAQNIIGFDFRASLTMDMVEEQTA